jgi:hypothetical protein
MCRGRVKTPVRTNLEEKHSKSGGFEGDKTR